MLDFFAQNRKIMLAIVAAAGVAGSANAATLSFAPKGDYDSNSSLVINEGLGDHNATQTLKMNANTLDMGGGTLNMGSGKITNLTAPTSSTDAVSKEYVDDAIAAAVAPLPTTDSDTTYSAGTGIKITGTTIKFDTGYGDSRYARSVSGTSDQVVATGSNSTGYTLGLDASQVRRTAGDNTAGVLSYSGNTQIQGQFNSSSSDPKSGNTQRLNYEGNLHANELTASQMYSTSYFYFSDRNLKKDIETIPTGEAVDIVDSLRPVSFVWKETDTPSLGLIAQEVEKVVPSAVMTDEDGVKSVDYVQLIAPLLATVKELNERTEYLENRVHELEASMR